MRCSEALWASVLLGDVRLFAAAGEVLPEAGGDVHSAEIVLSVRREIYSLRIFGSKLDLRDVRQYIPPTD